MAVYVVHSPTQSHPEPSVSCYRQFLSLIHNICGASPCGFKYVQGNIGVLPISGNQFQVTNFRHASPYHLNLLRAGRQRTKHCRPILSKHVWSSQNVIHCMCPNILEQFMGYSNIPKYKSQFLIQISSPMRLTVTQCYNLSQEDRHLFLFI